MPTYKYVAVNLQKQKIKGKFIAESESDLASQLAKRNLYLVSAQEYKGGTPSSFFTLGTGKVKMPELTSFCRQFAIMLSSGIQVLDCLEMMRTQSFSSYFKSIMQVIYDDVKSGDMLTKALEKHKKVFPSFFVSMVSVGEASGNLDVVFVSLADYYENDAAIKRKIKNAMIYPTMLGFMTIAIVILMLTFVVPTFKSAMSSLDVPIEGFTAVVYGISDFLVVNWQYILIAIAVIVGGLFVFFLTDTGKKFKDAFKAKFPFIKRVTINLASARFARALSILVASGMDLSSALDATAVILDNRFIQEKFKRACEDVRQGVTMADAFKKQDLFPPMLIQMIAVGENTNTIDEVLARSCRFFDEQVESSLNSITSKIQPIMLLVMGSIIAMLFLAVYSPMLSIMNNLGGSSVDV